MKQYVEPFDYANTISKALKKGILLTTCARGQVNTMTIGWGTIGVQWGLPVFHVLVRESRHTKELLDANGEFTINVPLTEDCSKILALCGTRSGRDTDKFRELGLHTEPGETISVPAIRELPLTLECKVLYAQQQDGAAIPQFVLDRYYPLDPETGKPDLHTVYTGQILKAYILE